MTAMTSGLPEAVPALPDVRVLEFSTGWCGAAVAGHLLAAQGADVTAIVPDGGNRSVEMRCLDHGKTLQHASDVNLPKRGPSDTVDVVIIDGAWLARLQDRGIDVRDWRSADPSLLIATVTGWGLEDLAPSAELVVQAETGVVSVTGPPGGPPTRTGVPMVACSTGLVAYTAIVAGLFRRDEGSAGAWLDIAERDVALMTHGNVLPGLFHDGTVPAPMGNAQPVSAPWNSYPTTDGDVVIIAISDRLWRLLLGVMNQTHLEHDPRFATLVDRVANREVVDDLITAWTATRTTKEVVDSLRAVDVPAATVADLPDVLKDSRLCERGVVPAGDPSPSGTERTPRAPFRVRPSSNGSRVPGRSGTAGRAPLLGVRVVEMGGHTASGLATRLLADLGADVIKAEIGGGDHARRTAPRLEDGSSYLWHFWNVGKRSVHVAPDDSTRRQWFRKLVESTDVFVENLAPSAVEGLGVDHGTLHAWNPNLVYCSISGYGLVGRDSGRRAFDTVVQAETGIMSITGDADLGATKTSASIIDNTTAFAAAAAAVTSLRLQQVSRNPTGALVDLALLDVGAWTTARLWPLVDAGVPVTRLGNRDPYRPAEDVYRCADGGSVAVAPETTDHDTALRELVDARTDDLAIELAEWCASRGATEVVRSCRDVGVPAGIVRRLDDVVTRDRTRARRMYVPLDLEPSGSCTVIGSPFRLVGEADWFAARRQVPQLGEHQEELDRELQTHPCTPRGPATGLHQDRTTQPRRVT